MNDYLRQPKTAVIEGLSSALAEITTRRDEANLPELNITDEEYKLIESEITDYVLSRFNLTFKEDK